MLKYEAIAAKLRKDIMSGKYSAGQQLPLEKEMCAQYDVSRITIKRAMDQLVKQGLVVKRRGSGTFVKSLDDTDVKELGMANQFNGFTATFKGRKVNTKVLRFDIIHPTSEVANKLQMSTDDFIYYVVRVRSLEGEPIVIEYTQMPIQLIPGIKMNVLEHSIYHYIDDRRVKVVLAEAGGLGIESGKTAATIALGRTGIIHGAKTYVIQNEDGQIEEPYSISAGLDYPGIGPMHANLAKAKRAKVIPVNDDEAVAAGYELTRMEGIIPAMESAHALGVLPKMHFKPEDIVVVTVSGRGDKDMETYLGYYNR